MTRRLRPLSLLIAVLTALALPGARALAGPPVAIDQYSWLTCPEGMSTTARIDDVHIERYAANTMVTIVGGLQLCRPPANTREVFAVAAYYTVGDARGVPVTLYDQPLPGMSVTRGIPELTTEAMCVIARSDVRLACFAIGWEIVGGVPVARYDGALPLNDPRVVEDAFTDLKVKGGSGPGCPLCP